MAEIKTQTSSKVRRHGSKRKRTLADDGNATSPYSKRTALELPQKRVGADNDFDESIGRMNPSLLTDHIAKKVKRSFRDLSSIELEEKYLSHKIFYDTSDFDQPRNLGNLPAFLEAFFDVKTNISTSGEDAGTPHTLVVAASGLRAADVTRLESYTTPA
jgi:protein CMS1